MKTLIQRVLSASVTVEAQEIASIDKGLLVFVGFKKEDKEGEIEKMAEKIINLRLFSDRLQHSLKDLNLELLLVSQFTLYADCNKGRRPDFFQAMEPVKAEKYLDKFHQILESKLGKKVKAGRFGANMKVALVNDGPASIILEY